MIFANSFYLLKSSLLFQALQEFLDLSETLTDVEMVAILPFWPSVYTKLATDNDGRARELAHSCLAVVVARVGRSLATCLKTLCGVWYLARSGANICQNMSVLSRY